MLYDSILARSFNRYEQKKLGYGALLGCLFIGFSFFLLFNPHMNPLPPLNFRLSIGSGLKMLSIADFSGTGIHMPSNTSDSGHATSNVSAAISSTNIIPNSSKTLEKKKNNNTSSSSKKSSVQHEYHVSSISNEQIADRNISNPAQPLMINKSDPPKDTNTVQNRVEPEPLCKMETRTDVCEFSGDIRIDSTSSSVFLVSSDQEIVRNSSWSIKPYARKGDEEAMNHVRGWSVKSVTRSNTLVPQCTKIHNVPAVIFSTGGYAGNNFHDFTDIIVPLFSTARKFNGDVKFLVTNRWSGFITKFQKFLENLSKHEIIDVDKETKDVPCFPSVIVGLKRSQLELKIDPLKSPYSMIDFKVFLRNSYLLRKSTSIKLRGEMKRKPRLLVISRKRTRTFFNMKEIVVAARRVGFEVVVAEPDSNLSKFSKIVNSCDVMMGVHGAGLTNMVFLPENAVLIQVVPIGAEWLSKTYFEVPSKDMKLKYLEYKIEVGESSLIREFPKGHEVFSNPGLIAKQGWLAFKSVYLEKQDVKLDLDRFRPTLLKAMELLHH